MGVCSMAWRGVAVWVALTVISQTGLFARTLYVDRDAMGAGSGASWTDACWCLQDALAFARSGDEIRVAEGIHKPDQTSRVGARLVRYVQSSRNRAATFQLKNGVVLTGGYAGFGQPDPNARDIETYKTILSGDLNGDDADVNEPRDLLTEPTRDDNSYHVVTGTGTNPTAVIDGFHITAGAAMIQGQWKDVGGGMINISGNPAVTDCVFLECAARSGGGMFNDDSSPAVTNCRFVRCSAWAGGGGMLNIGASPTLTDCTFAANMAADGGGMCNSDWSSPTLDNCEFEDNHTFRSPESGSSEGGGMYNGPHSSPLLTACMFTRNTAIDSGGGINNTGDAKPTLRDCTFHQNSALAPGGAVANLYDSHSTLIECTFTENSSTGWPSGGAIYGKDLTAKGCVFRGNEARDAGGAIALERGVATLEDCIFTGNVAHAGGGGIYLSRRATTTITGCTFTSNTADGLGGGLWEGGVSSVTITNCQFTGNTARGGAGLYLNHPEDTAMITDCVFRLNTAEGAAGAGGGGRMQFTGCTFSENVASSDAGGASGSDCRFIDCSFSNNSSGAYGGALTADGDSTVTDCSFTGNKADHGGAICLSRNNNTEKNPTLTSCRFEDNQAVFDGGALYNYSNASPVVQRCTFSGNRAGERGGGVYADYSEEIHPIYLACVFSRNSASYGGGMHGSDRVNAVLLHCVFHGNEAFYQGGALCGTWTSMALTGCRLVGNTAARGAAIHESWGHPSLMNCTLTSNSASSEAGGIYCHDASGLTLANCIVWNNPDGTVGRVPAQIAGLTPVVTYSCVEGWAGATRDKSRNITRDPLFVRNPNDGGDGWGDDPTTPHVDESANDDFGNLWLRSESPCVDTGNTNALPLDAFDLDADGDRQEPLPVDLDGAKRLTGTAVDMGAYEYHGVSAIHVDAGAPDGGSGANWSSAFNSLQDALALARDAVKPVEIRVAQGVYTPDRGAGQGLGDRESTFELINWVTVKGGYAGFGTADPDARDPNVFQTIFSGDLAGDDVQATDPCELLVERTLAENSFHVVSASATDHTAVLEGIVIRGGNASGSGSLGLGGGLYSENGSPMVRECVFRYNVAYTGGGLHTADGDPSLQKCRFSKNAVRSRGAALSIDGGTPVLESCVIVDNVSRGGGGGMFCSNTVPRLVGCAFSGNWAADRGGAVYCYESDPRLIDCEFSEDRAELGGGLFAHKSDAALVNCVFRREQARQGGAVFSQRLSVVSVVNCIFRQNRASERGGGLFNQASDVSLSSCTLTHNVAEWQGGAMFSANSDVTLSNSIFWQNIATIDPEIASDGSSVDLRATFCDVLGGLGSMNSGDVFFHEDIETNLDTDPDLTPDGHLTGSSACIDAGSSDGLLLDELDLDNDLDVREPIPWDIDADPRQVDANEVSATGTTHKPAADIGADEFVDSDADGLPNWWEETYFGDPTAAGADDDPDGDALTNLQEYELFGSNPKRPPLYVDVKASGDPQADGTASHPFATLRDGLAVARDGDTVLVAAGTYSGADNRGLDFQGRAIVLCATEGSDVTVIDCEDKGRAFDFHSGESAGAAVLGFTIVNGRADCGGAIRCEFASPQIYGCAIIDCNDPAGYAGAMYSHLGFPTLANCTIANNGLTSIWLEHSGARILGTVELIGSKWAGQNAIFSGSGTVDLWADAMLSLKDSRIRCNLAGSGVIAVPLGSELVIEAAADVNLAGDEESGRIQCDGLLRVRDQAQINNAQIVVTRASFEDDTVISNSVIQAEAGSPYGQFFVEDTAHIVSNEIHADGDRYMDLDPSAFAGIVQNNRIYVTITEGQGNTLGGLLELRGRDAHASSCASDQFLCPLDDVPDFSMTTWTIEQLELAPEAKINLANRFDFGNGDLSEVLYVNRLVLRDNSILNTAFNRVYYKELDQAETATILNLPILGFSLNNIAFDDPDDFASRVITNNYEHPQNPEYSRIHVRRIAGAEPDPAGIMEMRNLTERDPDSAYYGLPVAARAKALFAKSSEDQILLKFEYLFGGSYPGDVTDPMAEIVVYLSDAPQLLNESDPSWHEHYLEVARIRVPESGRPGSPGSGRFALFEKTVSKGHLNFVRGTRVELQLVGSTGTCVWINNWDPLVVQCEGICLDVSGDNFVSSEDLFALIGDCGTGVGAQSHPLGANTGHCLEGPFSVDGYVDTLDVSGWDWILHSYNQRSNLCEGLALTQVASGAALYAVPQRGSRFWPVSEQVNGYPEGLLVLGKLDVPSFDIEARLGDGFYLFSPEGQYADHFAGLPVRCNVRVAHDRQGMLHVVNCETGLWRVQGGEMTCVIAPGRHPLASEPRYQDAATVQIGIQTEGGESAGRPLLDVAFSGDSAYVAPVVVQPELGEPYTAAAQIRRRYGDESRLDIVRLYAAPGSFDEYNHVREIEADVRGNLYVLNVYEPNDGDVLWRYGVDGSTERYNLNASEVGSSIRHPVGMCLSENARMLYLASGRYDREEESSSTVYGLSVDGPIIHTRTIQIQGLEHVTSITEDPANQTLYVVGFSVDDTQSQFPNPFGPAFYLARWVRIPPGADTVQAENFSGAPSLALPMSASWVDGQP